MGVTLITCTYDLVCLIIGLVGTALCVCQFALNDWDVEKTMFKEEK